METLPQIIRFKTIDSTSLYIRRLLQHGKLEDFTTVVAQEQLKGQGQRGTTWQSEAGKNLLVTVLKNFESLPVTQHFGLNICVSRALYDVLKSLEIPDVSVKWPNDLMSGTSKVCGILIENIVQGHSIKQAIIGIGLNVNQTTFPHLERVASLHTVTGQYFEVEELLHKLRERLRYYLLEMEGKTVAQLLPPYEALLFRKGVFSDFREAGGQVFKGYIRGVSPAGKLVLVLEDGTVRKVALKEVSLLY